MRRDWLPEGATPELDNLRSSHLALLDRAAEVGSRLSSAQHSYEAEDLAYSEALTAKAQGQSVEIPERTPPGERAAVVGALEDEAGAVATVLEQFVAETVADIADNFDGWTAALSEEDAEAARRVEEARRALAEAEAGLGARSQLRAWLQRTAGRHPLMKRLDGRHIAYGDLAGVAGPLPERDPEAEVALGDPVPATTAMSPEARAALLAERASRRDTDTTTEDDQ